MENKNDNYYTLQKGDELTGKAKYPDDKNSILKQRARLLMVKPRKYDKSPEKIELLEFSISDEHYGIVVEYICEVISSKEFTPLPCTPNFILGIINVRGKIIAVMNLKKFLNLPDKTEIGNNKIIMVKHGDIELGILADEIFGSRDVILNKLQPAVTTVSGILNDYITGVTEDRLIVLNIKTLLENDRIIINEEV